MSQQQAALVEGPGIIEVRNRGHMAINAQEDFVKAVAEYIIPYWPMVGAEIIKNIAAGKMDKAMEIANSVSNI